MAGVTYYRNEETGELAPPHLIGTDDDGRLLYQFVPGWVPADSQGEPIDCEQDYDGNWVGRY